MIFLILLSPRPGSLPSGVPTSYPHAAPAPRPSRSTSPSIQGENSCLLLLQIAPRSHNSHYSWLVKFTLGIHANICLLQPHPGTFILLSITSPHHKICIRKCFDWCFLFYFLYLGYMILYSSFTTLPYTFCIPAFFPDIKHKRLGPHFSF